MNWKEKFNMFSSAYKQDNEQIFASDELIRKTKIKMKGTMQKKQVQQNYFSKGAIAFAIMAVMAGLGVLGSNMLGLSDDTTHLIQTTKANNWFNFTVSASERVNTNGQFGLNQRQTDESFSMIASNTNNSDLTLGYSFDFKYEGENIVDVKLSVDKGYFGYFDENHQFVKLGETYTVGEADQAVSNGLVWQIHYSGAEVVFPELPAGIENMTPEEQANLSIDPIMIDGEEEPRYIAIKAIVVFKDGEVQEQSVVYDLQNGSLILSEE
jgi:hypothetical protein